MNLLELGAEPYVLLTTFRRDGTPVATPLWAARDGEAVYVWTPLRSAKVKRLRHTSRVLVAPCTMRGEPTGEAVEGVAELLDKEGSARVRKMIKKKYRLQGWLIVGASELFKGKDSTVGIRITGS
ncbi:PPOX class F420-dependent oxidoreductase [Luedemannella helvata]|uniref:PPOX class F420-dependent oxidoreductase n=1 Tax=Luedemannella helvata TaxID=349315 RepID=UPI0031E1E408